MSHRSIHKGQTTSQRTATLTIGITQLTAADDAFDRVRQTGDIANGRRNKHVRAARIGRDGRQQLTVDVCSHAHRHDAYVHVGKLPRLQQRRRPV